MSQTPHNNHGCQFEAWVDERLVDHQTTIKGPTCTMTYDFEL